MLPSSDFDYHQYYTDHIVPLLVGSSSFLGNCDYAKDFYCVLQRQDHLSNHSYLNATMEQEMNFLIIGEVAPFHRGTKLNVLGNHYAGKIGEPPIPVRDKSSAKDILRLVEPTGATDDLKALFVNQIVPVNEVILADKERDRLNNMHPLLTQECADSLGLHGDQHIFTVQLPKKFGAPVSAYNGDATQRTTKKKVLSLGGPKASKVSVAVEKPTEDITKSDGTALETGELKIGGFYNPTLLPNYQPDLFDLDKDKLVQHHIIDDEDNIVPCWSLYDRLRPGTLVLCKVSLHAYNISTRDNKFKRFYTLNTETVRILKEAQCPVTVPTSSKAGVSSASNGASGKAADEEFKMFTSKKRAGKRGATLMISAPSEMKSKGKRKATDMDTGN